MPRKAAEKPEKAVKPHIPDINWAVNNSSLVWSLLAEINKAENYCVLYGKKESSENTSGETKVTVYNRIAEAILPDMYALDPRTVGKHVKSKLESLKKLYQNKAKRLLQTGEGVNNKDGSQGSEETLPFYIMGDGPCVETPPHAVNIWSMSLYLFICLN
ncbi:hypothetical protein B0H34DRAFT_752270 [Crassisporium funariophilum]|nr:hypothetical protein B0H34DRAFT_752270 [Crassisporium funariophilum]